MSDKNKSIEKLLNTMAALRSENGCPWDKEQTIQSLRPYIIEEAFETVEALDQFESSDENSVSELKKELGDLLLQIVFISQMAKEENLFDFFDIADTLSDKLIRRHPHVFGSEHCESSAEVLTSWNLIKKTKEKKKHLLDGIPKSMPALLVAKRYSERAASIGFDWENWEDVTEKIKEEFRELLEAINDGKQEEIEHELGDFLFATINLGRKLGVDSEKALKMCSERFKKRFDKMEELEPSFIDSKKSLEELEELWQKAKKELKKG
ncbi:MAG: nucleoside triphosphate pyrophosphohydrolase [bacterium]